MHTLLERHCTSGDCMSAAPYVIQASVWEYYSNKLVNTCIMPCTQLLYSYRVYLCICINSSEFHIIKNSLISDMHMHMYMYVVACYLCLYVLPWYSYSLVQECKDYVCWWVFSWWLCVVRYGQMYIAAVSLMCVTQCTYIHVHIFVVCCTCTCTYMYILYMWKAAATHKLFREYARTHGPTDLLTCTTISIVTRCNP